jgi:GMP synthase (glutamine-hydrolysing)
LLCVKAIVFEHADHEGAGLLGDALAQAGVTVERRLLHRGDALPPSTSGFDLVIGMGGPQDAWDDERHSFLAQEAALLAASARAGTLTLGVCLGAQLLARGLGARVYRGPRPELGVGEVTLTDEGRADPLLAPFDRRAVLHWHSDTFELPSGTTRLASTALYANQAFRIGRAWGVQFHVECDGAMRREWSERGAAELRAAGVEPASLWAPGTDGIDERGRAFAGRLVELASGREPV